MNKFVVKAFFAKGKKKKMCKLFMIPLMKTELKWEHWPVFGWSLNRIFSLTMGFSQVVVEDMRFTLQRRNSNNTNIETQATLIGKEW